MFRQRLYLENKNQRLRHSDQMKEDVLTTLSERVMKLMVEGQELKGTIDSNHMSKSSCKILTLIKAISLINYH